MSDADVAAVRAFNRFYTRHVGALGSRLAAGPWSLTEARTLFELAQADAREVAALRAGMGMDAGQLSRVLGRLEAQGLVARSPAPRDARRQVARLTDAGREAFARLDLGASAEVAAQLDRLPTADRRRLVAALDEVRSVLGGPRDRAVTLRAPEPGDLGWIVQRHGEAYADELGWDASFEALVARVVADFAERAGGEAGRGEAAWIAEVDGRRAGCVMCVRKDAGTAQLRLLLVDPAARGLGVGRRLVDTCLRFARRSGYEEIVLWTNDVLADARRLYERAGFALHDEAPHRSFGQDLVGQHWARKL